MDVGMYVCELEAKTKSEEQRTKNKRRKGKRVPLYILDAGQGEKIDNRRNLVFSFRIVP